MKMKAINDINTQVKHQNIATLVILMMVFVLSVLAGCDNEKMTIEQLQQPIVNAYLFDDKPIEFVKIKKSVPFGNKNKKGEPITGLEITIRGNDKSITLEPKQGKPGHYHYPGPVSDFPVIAGETYKLNFQYNGKSIFSETTVPDIPANLEADKNTLSFYSLEGMDWDDDKYQEYMDENSKQEIKLKWKNPDNKYYLAVIDYLDTDSVFIHGKDDGQDPGIIGIIGDIGFDFIKEPSKINSKSIFESDIKYLGRHRVKIYAVNDDFVKLYKNMIFDSRNLKEPPTNILNGKGFFSGFSSKSIEFTVKHRTDK